MATPVSRTQKYSFILFSRAHSGAPDSYEVTVLLLPTSKGQVPFLCASTENEAGAVIPDLLRSFGVWRKDASVVHCSVGYWVWALSVTPPGCASGTSQRELDPCPLESQGPQIRECEALWVKPASGSSLPSLEHRKQLCLATSRK